MSATKAAKALRAIPSAKRTAASRANGAAGGRPRTKIYSFNLSDFEAGKFVATRYSPSSAVGGDWVCVARSDAQALKLARDAAQAEWTAPETRDWSDFEVEFVDSVTLSPR